MNRTVAVLMATYNGEKYIRQQLDSIFSQTYQNFQLYISDDCSTDATIKIIQTYIDRYPGKITYIANEYNRGFVKNFENLLYTCSEEYIALADQDDVWHNTKLEMLMDAMSELEASKPDLASLVHSDLSLIDQDGNTLHKSYFQFRNYKLKSCKDIGHILGPCGVMGNTLLINNKLKETVLPFPDTLDAHDYWIAIHAEIFGQRRTLHTQLVKYRIHSDNYSNNTESLYCNNKKKHFSRSIRLPYMQTNRRFFLPLVLVKTTNQNDRKSIEAFLEYLDFDTSRLKLYYNLIKYSLVKRDVVFRVKLFFKIFFTKSYNA